MLKKFVAFENIGRFSTLKQKVDSNPKRNGLSEADLTPPLGR